MKLKIELEWYVYGIVSMIYAVTQVSAIMYVVFLMQLYFTLCALKKSSEKRSVELINLIVVTLFLPDNYTIIAVSFLILMLDLLTHPKLKKKNSVIVVCTLAYLAFNIFINMVPVQNIVMSVIYTLPFFVLGFEIKKLLQNNTLKDKIVTSLKYWIAIEVMTVVVYLASHLSVVRAYRDMDWVTGTLGTFQCNVLMCICTFSFLIFLTEYTYTKNRSIKWLVLSGVLAVSTGAVAYTIFFGVSLVAIILISSKVKLKQKILILVLFVVASGAFVAIVPSWMSREIMLLGNTEYLFNRVTKVRFYDNTFVQIPQNEGIFKFLVGNGLGTYSSRAAETCAGGYVGIYDSLVDPYETRTRIKYISGMNYGGDGLTASSQASMISLQGELGLIGLIAFVGYLLIKMNKTKDPRAKIAVLYFILLMVLDNTIEFAKYAAIFWLAYYMCDMFVDGRKQILVDDRYEKEKA